MINIPVDYHDCAQVERDAADLRKALAEAVRRLTAARAQVLPLPDTDTSLLELLDVVDLVEVLDRTSKPGSGVRLWQWPDDDEDNLPQGVDVDMVPKA